MNGDNPSLFVTEGSVTEGSGSTQPDTNSARGSTRPWVNSVSYFSYYRGVFYKCMMLLDIIDNNFRLIYSGYVYRKYRMTLFLA